MIKTPEPSKVSHGSIALFSCGSLPLSVDFLIYTQYMTEIYTGF